MGEVHFPTTDQTLTVRSCQSAEDSPKLQHLQKLGQTLAHPDQCAIRSAQQIQQTYQRALTNHLWVAETSDQIVAALGLVHEQASIARIRDLWVASQHDEHADALQQLLHKAATYCFYFGYLKLRLPAPHAQPVPPQFARAGLRCTQQLHTPDHQLLEFYVDLHQQQAGRQPVSEPCLLP